MDWLVGQQVDIHPFGTAPEEAIVSGKIIQAGEIGFLLDTDQGNRTHITWATIKGYQVTMSFKSHVGPEQLKIDAQRIIDSL